MTKREQIYYLLLNLLSSILMVSETTNGIQSAVLVLLSLLMIPKPIAILPMMFVSSWSISFVALPGVAAFFYYFVLFALSVFLNRHKIGTKVKPFRYTSYALIFALWIFFTGFLSASGDWYMPMKVALFILPVILFSKYCFYNLSFLRISLVVIALFFTVYFLSIALFNPVEFISEIEENDAPIRVIQTFSFRHDMNPNTASMIVLLLFVILFCGAFRIKKYWMIGFALLDIVLLMYLGSRTAFFAAITTAFVYPVFALKTSFIKKTFILVVISALFLGTMTQRDKFDRADRLILSSVQEDEGNGRFFTWNALIEWVIPNNLTKGIGVGRDNYSVYGFEFDADNMYIDLLCQTGVIGIALFLLYYLCNLFYLFKCRGPSRDWDFLIAIFLAWLVEGWGESVFDTPLFWFCGLIAILVVNNLRAQEEKKKQIPRK